MTPHLKSKLLGCLGVLILLSTPACLSWFNQENEFFDAPVCACDDDCGCNDSCACDPDCSCNPIGTTAQPNCRFDFGCPCDLTISCDVPCSCDPECRLPGPPYGSNLLTPPCNWCLCDETTECDGRSCVCDPDCEQ